MKRHRGCDAPNCAKRHYARGYCHAHYMRLRRNGTIAPQPSGKASPNYGRTGG